MIPLPIVDRYVLKQVATPLLTAMTIGLLVLLAERMVRLLDVTLGKKNSFAVVFELLAYLVPHYLGLALPAAMFLGLLFGFNKLSRDSEIDAFLAGGIGHHRLARPVVVLAILLALVSLFVFGWLQPHTRYAYRAAIFTVKNVEVFYLAEEGVFMQAGNRTFILDKLSRADNAFERIFLFEDRGPEGAETVTATSGSLIDMPSDPRPVLRLEGAHRLKLDAPIRFGETGTPPLALVGTFDRVDTPLGRISDKAFRKRGEDQRELTLPELVAALSEPPANITPAAIRSELHKRLVAFATIVVLPFLALPFAIGRRRGQRAYRFGIALVILIAYNEVIEQGAIIARVQGVSPYLTTWLPFTVLAGFAFWRFHAVCFRVGPDRLEPLFDSLSGAVASALNALSARRSPGRA